MQASAGSSAPLGATVTDGGVNFSLYSRDATCVDLLLFDHIDDACASRAIELDPAVHRSYHYWHVFVSDLRPGQLYGYRVHGPYDPEAGLRFDPKCVLLDPYGRGVAVPNTSASGLKSVVVDPRAYDWEGDAPLNRPSAHTIIYEMHVRGFTANPNSGVSEKARGTYRGLIEKIPYLQDLGVSAVELLPLFQFDPLACPEGLVNYWGYQPISYFAPHQAYSSRRDPLGSVHEFRDMVKALHRAGIEVILDVVFNHTAEGDHNGPTLSFRGIDNRTYYLLQPDRSRYADYTGCGNTLYAQHPVVRRMILDSLRYWVQEMHVDGFRFDLASILARGSSGQVIANPPVIWDIESDPVLAQTKMIAEAWDAAGVYQVGTFIGDSWKEWNGRFRDDVRAFFRSENGALLRFADRLVGSNDIYGRELREAEQSVNFVACHDGFTLNDLVTYNQKHNQANGQDNHDGADDNRSWNCGVEGPTADPEVEALRNRQVKNFLTVMLLSLGMPMLLMGDEVRRTQSGNNNAYCHDDVSTWFDWSLVRQHADIHRFTKLLIARRLLRDSGSMTLSEQISQGIKGWHGTRLNEPDWSDTSHSVALSAELPHDAGRVHLIFNAYWEPLDFELPPTPGGEPWRRWIDTSLEAPDDIVPWQDSAATPGRCYRAGPRSVVILWTTEPR